jgi:hypothetical protein
MPNSLAVEHVHSTRRNRYIIHAETEAFASIPSLDPQSKDLPDIWIGYGWFYGVTGLMPLRKLVRGSSEKAVQEEIFRLGRELIDALP